MRFMNLYETCPACVNPEEFGWYGHKLGCAATTEKSTSMSEVQRLSKQIADLQHSVKRLEEENLSMRESVRESRNRANSQVRRSRAAVALGFTEDEVAHLWTWWKDWFTLSPTHAHTNPPAFFETKLRQAATDKKRRRPE